MLFISSHLRILTPISSTVWPSRLLFHSLASLPAKRIKRSPPHVHTAASPKRARVGDSSLIINGELKDFESGASAFSELVQAEGQAYFDRTRYISKLHEFDDFILFCRPRRFGKSLTTNINHSTRINPNPNLQEMPKILNNFLNCSIKAFYRKYAAYLGGNFTDLCQNIDNEDPIVNLAECAESVRYAIQQDERLAGIEGIYILVDEYDSFPNSYLNLPKIVGGSENAWDETAVGRTFRSFWATIKALGTEGIIKRTFITGISPLSLSSLGSAFNVARNLSFHKDLAGLCGLTSSDLEAALTGIYEDPKVYDLFFSEMTEFFNGYHFCQDETVNTVYNTETCLAYLQCRIEGVTPETEDPENSEVSEVFLRRFATSAPAIRDFEKALECDEKGNFMPIEYSNFKLQFTLRDLSNEEDYISWRSLIVYFGGLTFHPEKPTTHLKIPNRVAANRIALAVLGKYDLRNSLTEARS
ncbi:DUF1703-domain-containing protein [Terfezia boudieri ATCC MYA-4762]|uniref:DUF1703-domain-containing protein n=1 Tax=Terfezia boudieri ATCC MYA-4762 TaxID=1051890 RepID=A0A3N4LMW0_9PEZI|nr:DUF1703-domain-containing protein [Terfezia boudieri ATCC MYA-4762]